MGGACVWDDESTCISTITESSAVAAASFHHHLHTLYTVAWPLSPVVTTLCSLSPPEVPLDTGPLHMLFSAWNVLSPLHLVNEAILGSPILRGAFADVPDERSDPTQSLSASFLSCTVGV